MRILVSLAMGFGLFFLLLGSIATPSTYANPAPQICAVPGDYSTIQVAVSDSTCAAIEVGIGNFQENLIISRTVTIYGQGATDTTVDGNASGRVFEVKAGVALTLSNLSVANGLSPLKQGSGWRQPGAGIFISDGQLVLSDTAVTNNQGGAGAGIGVENSTIIIQASSISGNRSEPGSTLQGGGGIFVTGESDAKIIDSVVRDNHTVERGGGISIKTGTLAISNTLFSDNEAGKGGAIDSSNFYDQNKATVNIANSSFTGNIAGAGTFNVFVGGAIYNGHSASMNIISTTISSNEGRDSNISNEGQLTLRNSEVISHTSTGIDNGFSGEMLVARSEISGNQRGGIRNQGTMTVTESIFEYNQAKPYGGAVHNLSRITIIDSFFQGNKAESRGGAINSQGWHSEAIVTGSSFLSNMAGRPNSGADGGAIANTQGYMTIDNASFVDNYAGFNGGAILNDGHGELHVTDSTISSNFARQSGGAIFNDGESLFVLSNSTLYNNQAGSDKYGGNTLHSGWNSLPEFRIVNSILIASGDNCGGDYDFHSLGHNIFSDSSCDPISSDQTTDTNVGLFPLSYNDGRSLIYELLPGSAAIDAGRIDMCPAADQRGVPRPLDGDLDGSAGCDIGAYEFDPENPPGINRIFLPAISR